MSFIGILFGLLLMDAVRADTVSAQTIAEQQAAKETYIDGLRLVDTTAVDPRLAPLGINLGYVEKDTRPGNRKYSCGALSPNQARLAGAMVATALRQLPEVSLKNAGLRFVILCSSATAAGQPIGGIPVPPLGLLMLAVGNDVTRIRYACLHELYHFIEYRSNTFVDPEWQYRFGAGYANSYQGRLVVSRIGGGKRGFLNIYSETFPHEERAELFASLLLHPIVVVNHIKATDDRVLDDKVRRLIDKCERLLGYRIARP